MTASITGTVEDATGAVVRDATITVKSQETGATRTVTTDDSGNYRVLSLPLGPQELKAEKQGFKSVVRTGVSLEVGQEAVVNFRLEVGELVQQMAVSEEAPVVNVTTASVSGMVDERQIKELPLNGRSFDNLIALNPGTINYSALKSPNTSTSNGNTFSVAGRRTSENLFLLNGVEYMGSSQLAGHSRRHERLSAWELTPSASSTCSRTLTPPNTASARGRRSAPSRNPERINFTAPFLNFCETARSIRRGRSIREPFLPSEEISSEARPADLSRKIVCFCSATTKDFASRWI